MGVVIDSWNNADMIRALGAVMNGETFFDPQISQERVKEFYIDVQGERWMDVMRKYFASRGSETHQVERMAYT
jgi:hypothetical protein